MRYLRTNTATRITVGPFLDKTDGVTPETALTVTSCKLTLMVDTADVPTLILDTAPTASGGANDMVHVTNDDAGFYDLELAAANVNYLGRAMLAITDAATHCPVFHEFMIVPAHVYDGLFLGTDNLQVDAVQLAGTAQTGRDIGASVLLSSGTGTGQVKLASGYVAMTWADIGSPTTTVNLSGTTIATTQKVDVETIKTQTITCGAGVTVLASVGTAATSTAQTGDSFARIGAAGAGLTSLGDTRIANLDATISSRMATYTQPTGFLAATFPTTVASTTNITAGTITTTTNLTNLPTMPTDWITAAGLSAGAVTEIQAGLSTLTQTQVTGGAYALNSASFAFNAALDFTTTQKAATLARVTLTDTVTTYTGNTPQTGDAYAIVSNGTHGNAALKTLVDDVPTTAEFNARTLAAADYFDAAVDKVYLANGAQGGSSMVLTAERIIVTSTTLNEPAVKLTGDGAGAGLKAIGGSGSGPGIYGVGGFGQGILGESAFNAGIAGSSTSGDGIKGISFGANGIYAGSTNAEGLFAMSTNDVGVSLQSVVVTGTTTLTGAVTATHASNDVRGIQVNDFTAAAKALLQTEANDAIVANNLDHLMLSAVDTDFATTVHLNSVIGHLADNGTAATFSRTTDSLEALRDRGDAAWTTATGFSTHSAADVWAVGTRTLTAFGFTVTTADAATIAAIEVDTQDIQSRLPAALVSGRMDASVGNMAANVLTASALAGDAVTEIFAGVLTSQLTESYAADGVAPTLAQAVFLIQQAITEFTISGVTTTIKRLDGTTTAATLTLNDGTTPTGVTRAT